MSLAHVHKMLIVAIHSTSIGEQITTCIDVTQESGSKLVG